MSPNVSVDAVITGTIRQTIIRRLLFLAALLLSDSVRTVVSHFLWPQTILRSPDSVEWISGLCTTRVVLAVWLVTRVGIWRTPSGLVRVIVYITSYLVGDILSKCLRFHLDRDAFSVDSWISFSISFDGVTFHLLSLATLATLLYLPLRLISLRLFHSDQRLSHDAVLSLLKMIGFTGWIALLILCVGLVTNDKLPYTPLSGLTRSESVAYWFRIHVLNALSNALSTMIVLFCLSKRAGLWWIAALVLGSVAEIYARQLAFWIQFQIVEPTRLPAGALFRGFHDSWQYRCGQVTTLTAALIAGSLFGVKVVRIKRSSGKTENVIQKAG